MENHDVDVERDGNNDKSSLREVTSARDTMDEARDVLQPKQTLAIPRKPIQKSISSHFTENISPTTPTGPTVTFPDIELVSPESSRSVTRDGIDTSGFLFDFDLRSPQTIRTRSPSPTRSQYLPNTGRESMNQERPLSFVSEVEEIRYEEAQLRSIERVQRPEAPQNEYTAYLPAGSQDDLLKAPHTKRKDTRNWFSRHSADWWLVEFLSFTVSVLATIAIIIILKVYDNQPLSKIPDSITLNSLLALFITLTEVGLMIPIFESLSQLKWIWFKENEKPLIDFETFDQASRGFVGAIKLLKTLKFGHFASMGAVISILSLAISPLTQQIVSYHDRIVPSAANPLTQAARSDAFTAFSAIQGSTGVPDLSMQQAVKMGLFNAANESISAAPLSCPTGNCTWPKFSSLAICSKVANVTSFIEVSAIPRNMSTSMGYMVNNNVTLPNGAYLQAGEMAMNVTMPSNLIDGQSVLGANYSLAFSNDQNLSETSLSNYFVIWQNNAGKGQGQYGAVEVLLHWCVNTYSTEVQAGVPTTNINSTSVSIASSIVSKRDIGNGTAPKDVNMSPTNGSANYRVDGSANAALADYLGNTFQGTYAIGLGGGYNTEAAQVLVSALYDMPGQAGVTGQVADNMQFSGVQNLTQNIAMSMTNNIRNRKFTGAAALGTSYSLEIYVHVSWPWLTFLILLIFSSFAFLLATVIKTRTTEVEVLRSSALATMCCLGQEAKEYMGPVELRGHMREKAEGLRLRLGKGEVGWSLLRRLKG